MQKFPVIAGVALFALVAPLCYALGFGEIELRSALNQPLKAEIPLLAVKPAERDQVSVDVASVETFKRFGIERPGVLDQIDIEVVPGSNDSRLRIMLNSRVPIQEPFLTFLLEANWPDGRAIREYTVLLDPPISEPSVVADAAPAPAQFADEPEPASQPQFTPDPSPQPARAEIIPAPPASAPVFETAPEPESEVVANTPPPEPTAPPAEKPAIAAQDAAPAGSYGPVAADETLWGIAKITRPQPDLSRDQMMLAIYLANLEDFDSNVNRMHAGAMLAIPPARQIRSIDKAVAAAEISDQARRFADARKASPKENSTQVAANSEAADGPRLKLEPASESPSGQASPGAADQDSAGGATGTAPETQNSLAAAPATDESALSNSNEPIAPPEALAAEPGRLNGEGTGGEANVAAAELADSAAASDPTAPTADSETPQQSAQAGSLDDLLEQGETGQPASLDNATTPENTEPGAIAGNTGVNNPRPGNGDGVSGVGVDSGTPRLAASSESVIPESGGLITPQRLLVVLGAILLIVALLMLWNRRQSGQQSSDYSFDTDEASDDDALSPAASDYVAGAAAAAPAAGQPDVEELLEDADSHIAYELYDEALAALHLGLSAYPGHPALAAKLLEVHHAAGDRDAFMRDLDKYFPGGAADSEQWPAIAAMARDFAPDDARFEAVAGDEQIGSDDIAGDDWSTPETATAGSDTTQPDDELAEAAEYVTDDQSDEPLDTGTHTDAWDNWQDTSAPTRTDDTVESIAGSTAYADSNDNALDIRDLQDDLANDDELSPENSLYAASDAGDQASEDAPDAGMDFDLADFDAPASPATGEPRPEEQSAETPEAASDLSSPETLDFDIHELELNEDSEAELDLPPLDVQDADVPPSEMPQQPGTQESELATPDVEWSEGLRLDNEQDLLETPAAPEQQPGASSTQDPLDEMLHLEDGPEDSPEQGRAEEPAADPVSPAQTGPAAPAAEVDEDEVIIKLDLARAYIDMAEPEMAASLLEEVLTQGSPEQQREAKSLLERTG